jgi:hypothetical protein
VTIFSSSLGGSQSQQGKRAFIQACISSSYYRWNVAADSVIRAWVSCTRLLVARVTEVYHLCPVLLMALVLLFRLIIAWQIVLQDSIDSMNRFVGRTISSPLLTHNVAS